MAPFLAQRTERSFERIYNHHVGDVYRYALAVLRNPSDAEDVTQTTFLNAYRAYCGGERPRQPQNWLITIAHNVCRQRFRQAQRRVEEVAYDDNVAESFVSDDDAPTAEDIRRAIGHLAFNQRAALVMRELEGRTYAEIAEILDLSVSAVETLIFRARRALREQLEGGLTCREAELAISRQLDGRLPRSERGPLRAHLRECGECAGLARKLRAQRSAIRALGLIPLPSSLAAFSGGAAAGSTAAGLGTGLALKAAAGVAASVLVAGGGYEVARQATKPAAQPPVRAERGPVEGVRGNREVPLTDRQVPNVLVQAAPAARTKEAAPPGKAVGHRKKAERAQATTVASAEQPLVKADRPAKAEKPAGNERARGRGQPARKVQKARPERRPKKERPARPARPAAAAEKPPPGQQGEQGRPEEKPRGNGPPVAPPVEITVPTVPDVVETVVEPIKKGRK